MTAAICIDCDARFKLNPAPRLGQIITCPECGTELEVISLDPLELDWAYYDEYDDDDDWD
jgi:alpha-aminoadipate carrier protein LysW